MTHYMFFVLASVHQPMLFLDSGLVPATSSSAGEGHSEEWGNDKGRETGTEGGLEAGL